MKRVVSAILIVTMLFCLTACGKAESMQEKKILARIGGEFEWSQDMSTIEKLEKFSEIIVMGTIIEAKEGRYDPDSPLFIFDSTIECEEIFKGESKKSISFIGSNGYIRYDEYKKSIVDDPRAEGINKLTKKETENGYIECAFAGSVIFEEGKQYILFLAKNDTGDYYVEGLPLGIMEIDGEYINIMPNGHEYMLADVLDQLRNHTQTADNAYRAKNELKQNNTIEEKPLVGKAKYDYELLEIQRRYEKMELHLNNLEKLIVESQEALKKLTGKEQSKMQDLLNQYTKDRQRAKEELQLIKDKSSNIKNEIQSDDSVSANEKSVLNDKLNQCETELNKIMEAVK